MFAERWLTLKTVNGDSITMRVRDIYSIKSSRVERDRKWVDTATIKLTDCSVHHLNATPKEVRKVMGLVDDPK